MITTRLSTLKINTLTENQYNRELEAGSVEENVFYLTPEEEKASKVHEHTGSDIVSGTIDSDRLPIMPVSKGGTNAATVSAARTNLDVYSKSETDIAISTAITQVIGEAIANSY